MRLTIQNPTQLHTTFGGGYVQEQHCDETRRYLPSAENREIGVAVAWLAFYALAALVVLIANVG